MNQEQLSAAIGGIEETMLSEALRFEPKGARRPIRRGVLIAACLAAVMVISAAAITLAGGWQVMLGKPKSAAEIALEVNLVGEDEEIQEFLNAVDGAYRVTGKAALAAYPLSDEVCARIRSNAAEGSHWHDYLSLERVENTYGIRLLRSDGEVCDIKVLEGVYGEDLPVAGGLFLSPSWVEQHAGWASSVSASLTTAAYDADDLSWGGATVFTTDEQTIREYDIQSLGVTAQIAFSNGEYPEAEAFFVKDDVSYMICIHPQPSQDAFEAACALLETLHY